MGARAGCFVSMALRLGDGTRAEPWCGRPEAGWGYPHPVPGGLADGNPRGSCHSVGAMFLLRDLVSPRTWLAMTSHLAGLFLGLAVMLFFVIGLSLGFSLLVLALVGLPILGLTLRVADWFARVERARIRLML